MAVRRDSGQASLESAVAISLSLLLLFATAIVFLWFGERLIRRQQYFECSRGAAGRQLPSEAYWGSPIWNVATDNCTPPNLSKRLKILVRNGKP